MGHGLSGTSLKGRKTSTEIYFCVINATNKKKYHLYF